ncbi:unnamed protein product [Parnassius mnemosyne]|uniref:Transposase n=1 Tax=Parnassius mnemosyne TaxID=213953 RepID=A0AAV1LGQ4_9NEOP
MLKHRVKRQYTAGMPSSDAVVCRLALFLLQVDQEQRSRLKTSQLCAITLDDRHVTYEQIRDVISFGMTAIQSILHNELCVRKLVSRWVPHNLSEDQKAVRVDWCRNTLQRFNRGKSNVVYNIVSGDESWIYSYEPERIHQSAVRVFEDEVKPTKVVRSRSVSKKMVATFVSKKGHVATIPLQERRTVTAVSRFVCQK